jgi:hypothetical protein
MPNEPIDPKFIKFADGLRRANDDTRDTRRLRWSPQHGDWFTWSVDEWILDDVGMPDTPPGSSFEIYMRRYPSGEAPDNVEEATAKTSFGDIFTRVEAVYAKYASRWPGLVWTWHNGGDWRNAIKRSAPGESTDPVVVEPPIIDVPPECMKRINEVRAFIANGIITAAQGQKMINEIVGQCTGADKTLDLRAELKGISATPFSDDSGR